MSNYIDPTEDAKTIRKILKKEFPNTKFRVRTSKYAGGSSITIYWTDGPRQGLVDSLVEPLRGADFDGMIDLKTYRHNNHLVDFIFTERSSSVESFTNALQSICDRFGLDVPPVATCTHSGGPYLSVEHEQRIGNERLSSLIWREFCRTSY